MFKQLKDLQWKKIGRGTLWLIVIVAFAVTVGFTEKWQTEMPCKEMTITIQDMHDCALLEEEDMQQLIHDKFGSPVGKPMHAINISLLENIVNNNPFVSHAEVFSTIDGKLHIEVVPRNPVVRVINSFNESFYIDEEGVFMPLSEKYSAPVPVANGYLYDKEAEHRLRIMAERESNDTSFHALQIEKVFLVASYIRQHEFWNAQVQQVFVNAEGDIELVPRVGNQTIVLGDMSAGKEGMKELDEKFNKLFLFYKEGMSKQGWDKYNVINLKYKDQVVCTKK